MSKNDAGKTRWDLMEFKTLNEMAQIMTSGAAAHGDQGWRDLENGKERYFAAAMRHITAYRNGEKLDKETGLPHLVHAICSLMFINELERHKWDKVDVPYMTKFPAKSVKFSEGDGHD